MKNLYVSDMDGTLLGEDALLSNYSRKVINEFYEKGILFTLASARDYESMREVAGNIKLLIPVIEYNGAFITDYETGRKLDKMLIENIYNKELYYTVINMGMSPLLNIHIDGQDYFMYEDDNHNEASIEYANYRKSLSQRHLKLSNPDELDKHEIIALNVIDKKERIEKIHDKLIDKFGKKLDIHMMKGSYSDEWYWINVSAIGANKADALIRLKKMVGEDIYSYSFGDNRNDLEMISQSDFGICVENGMELLKENAKLVIGKNSDDSVVKFIMKNEGMVLR